jgi:hypothetical protein
MSGLINSLLDAHFNKTPPPSTNTPKDTSADIRNLVEVLEEDEGPPAYDKARPLWSPFGPLPVKQDPSMPKACFDPNVDEEERIPFDVDARNAWLSRG